MYKSAFKVIESLKEYQRKQNRWHFNHLLGFYVTDRFLYRLSQSEYADKFALKGGTLLRYMGSSRLTKDVDASSDSIKGKSELEQCFRKIIAPAVIPEDWVEYDSQKLKVTEMEFETSSENINLNTGGSIVCPVQVGNHSSRLKFDVGYYTSEKFPDRRDIPTLLDFPPTTLLCYSFESVIAEKFCAMIDHGDRNSRMKDFFDIYYLHSKYKLSFCKLATSIQRAFEEKKTPWPQKLDEIAAFSEKFIRERQEMWSGQLLKRNRDLGAPGSFAEVVEVVKQVIKPALRLIQSREAEHGAALEL